MADAVDLANNMIDKAVSSALKQRSAGPVKIGSETCLECDEEIPMARRELGFSQCLICAEKSERKQSLFAG